MYNLHSVQCMCNDSYLCPPGCHCFTLLRQECQVQINAVSKFFGQNVINNTSTPE